MLYAVIKMNLYYNINIEQRKIIYFIVIDFEYSTFNSSFYYNNYCNFINVLL
jgi:hypothetical protein